MTIEIKAPTFPESISDGTVATWHKQPGEAVRRDEVLVDIETDKVVLEVVAPADGTLKEILKAEGTTVLSDEVIAVFVAGAVRASPSAPRPAAPATTPLATSAPADDSAHPSDASSSVSPAARKLAEENRLDLARINGTGRSGRITKEDVAKVITTGVTAPAANDAAPGQPQSPLARLAARHARRQPERTAWNAVCR